MLPRAFVALRRLLGQPSPAQQKKQVAETETDATKSSKGEHGVEPGRKEGGHARGEIEIPQPPAGGEEGEDNRPSRRARLVTAYLNMRAEEMLALLLEELSRESTQELSRAVHENYEQVAAEIASVRESLGASQREFSRLGRELVRTGATLQSMQEAVSGLGPGMERLDAMLQLAADRDAEREAEREREVVAQAERAAVEDMLATMDGLEAGLEDGRDLVQELGEAQRRLKDATVQRWWRAMGEASGVKRPLPTVPVAELEAWIGGIELTHRRLEDALARRGITPIKAVGQPFDPHFHEAVAVEAAPPDQDGLVLREQRRGYLQADQVLRLAEVVVGRAEASRTSAQRRRQRRNPDQSGSDSERGDRSE